MEHREGMLYAMTHLKLEFQIMHNAIVDQVTLLVPQSQRGGSIEPF